MSDMVVVKGEEVAIVYEGLQKYFRENKTDATVAASACLLLFASLLKGSGHAEDVGHEHLDRMFRLLDTNQA